MPVKKLEKRFGTIAIKKGFVEPEHIFEAMEIQIREDLEGSEHRLIGQILWEKGYITTEQIDEVVKSMGI
ncbi:MAG: hypothetical protein JRF31_06725 [Deltaproteobacteria bacterium]|nr:hypothetical protein [Deltaproteobacteria bacterium]MBW2014346.1 hypothetical protein [Deltaproteobacteria bacterium]MBW2088669.1 hypothetical protein [Deltaproteobacteria bacterium]MBW2320530.1 hypothetical protein [Deltaproteobacteria bacterium]